MQNIDKDQTDESEDKESNISLTLKLPVVFKVFSLPKKHSVLHNSQIEESGG